MLISSGVMVFIWESTKGKEWSWVFWIIALLAVKCGVG